MLYLEDYLEMIEHLPQELRDRFTEMRELDLTVQNNMDSLEKKTRTFFLQCKRGEVQNESVDTEFQGLRKEYYKVLEDADEKVAIATQIHELVERYLRRLDSELFKFKCELEADNNGITEILEKRSLEMDGGSSAATALMNAIGVNQKENRYFGTMVSAAALATSSSNSHGMLGGGVAGLGSAAALGLGGVTLPAAPTGGVTKDNRYRAPKPEKRRDSATNLGGGGGSLPEKRLNLGNNSLAPGASTTSVNSAVMRPITPSSNSGSSLGAVLNPAATGVVGGGATPVGAYNLQQLGGGVSASNAIAAAASQAIVATQQMQQGRRTASLKASYEAIHGAGGGPTEFWISRDIANAASAAAAQSSLQAAAAATAVSNSSTGSEKKQKKKLNASLSHAGTAGSSSTVTALSSAISLGSSSSSVSVDSIDMLPSSSSAAAAIGLTSLSLSAIGGSAVGASTSAAAAAAANRAAGNAASTSAAAAAAAAAAAMAPGSNMNLNENGLVVEQTAEGEWSYDPNEPRYCTCNQVSYGDMVACDNDACPYEWFHYPCVGITQPPKGKWYCPKCTASMRRRGNRKN